MQAAVFSMQYSIIPKSSKSPEHLVCAASKSLVCFWSTLHNIHVCVCVFVCVCMLCCVVRLYNTCTCTLYINERCTIMKQMLGRKMCHVNMAAGKDFVFTVQFRLLCRAVGLSWLLGCPPVAV